MELLRAAQAISDRAVSEAIAIGQDVMVETVLSSAKFRPLVERALLAGFEFGFVYVTVGSAALNIARVSERVAEGGHDVPSELVEARRVRSAEIMPWFAARAGVGLVLDNTGASYLPLAEKRRGDPIWRTLRPASLSALGLRLHE